MRRLRSWSLLFFLLVACTSNASEELETPAATAPLARATSTEIAATATTAPATPTPLPTPQPAPANCVYGYVLGGEDLTPPGLADAPRTFEYQVQQAGNETATVTYTAFPPSPAGDAPGPTLTFHQGTIEHGDYLEACGEYEPSGGALTVSEPDHFITTFPTALFLLVRHAERASSDPNSNLADPQGLNRAQALADITEANEVQSVYSSRFCRAAQTAQPSAEALGLALNVQPASSPGSGVEGCDPPITVPLQELPASTATVSGLAQWLLAEHPDQTVLVVGHSNTTPQFVQALTGASPCPEPLPLDSDNQCHIAAETFDLLFTVRRSPDANFGLVDLTTYGP